MCDYSQLRERSNSGALGFNSHDDALAFAKHCVENSRRWFRANSLRILEGYVSANLSLVLKVNAPFGAGVWDFVFRAIPSERLQELDASGPRCSGSANFARMGGPSNKHNKAVFAGITQIVQGAEKVIPSFVTIEASKERLDFRRRILANTPHAVIEIGGSIGERKSGAQGGVFGSGRVDHMIETSSEMLDNLGSEKTPVSRKALGDMDFVNGVNAVRVQLNQVSVWLFSKELIDPGFEVVEMFVCSREPEFCAKQRVFNGF
jgi:hypothetical protein